EMNDHSTKRTVLTIAVVSSFLVPFMGSSINIALPTIGAEFKADAVLLGWVTASYLLVSAMLLLPFGRAGDIYGRKKVFLCGFIIYTIGSLLSAFSVSCFMLIICRVIQGIGSSMAFGTAMAILTSVFPPAERGRAIGITVAAVYTGLSLGPFLGGFLTHNLGWRSIFYMNLPLGLIVIYLVLKRLKGEWAEAKGEPVDLKGSLLYALSLFLVMFGLSQFPSTSGIVCVTVGAVGFVVFFLLEFRTASPVIDIRVFRHNPPFVFSNLAAMIHYSSTYAVSFMLSLYLQYIKGLSAQEAGMILVSQPIIMALFSPFSGWLSDRIEPRVIASIGLAFTCVPIYLLSFLGDQTGLTYIIANLLVLGFGFALFSSPNSNAVMSSVEKRYYGVASGTLGTMRVIGQMLSMAVVMMVFSIIMGKVRITPEHYPFLVRSEHIIFTINGSLCFIAIFLSLARGRVRPGTGMPLP
ncbi:MAG: MFS transporter, partial [Pseudomonadota bacterium]